MGAAIAPNFCADTETSEGFCRQRAIGVARKSLARDPSIRKTIQLRIGSVTTPRITIKTAPVPEGVAVNTRGRSYKIIADVEIKDANCSGVIFAHGSRFGGHTLFIKDKKLYYVYSRARTVTLSVTKTATVVRMRITDSGIGFDPSLRPGGLGLVSMRERLLMVGGELFIHAKPGEGTELTAIIHGKVSPSFAVAS